MRFLGVWVPAFAGTTFPRLNCSKHAFCSRRATGAVGHLSLSVCGDRNHMRRLAGFSLKNQLTSADIMPFVHKTMLRGRVDVTQFPL